LELTVITDNTTDGVRTLRLRLSSPRGAPVAHLDLSLPGDLVAASVAGQPVKIDENASQRRFPLAAYNLGAQGIEITLSVHGTGVIIGTLADFSVPVP